MPLWRNRPLMITIILVIVLLVVLIITAGDNNMSGTESVVGSILSPVQRALYSATDAIGDFFSRIFVGGDLRVENQELLARVAELEAQLQDYGEVKSENERLAAMLGFDTQDGQLEMVSARIIGKSPGHWFHMFVIDAGQSSGVQIDMPVVSGDGLVGRVVATGANWSRVMAIIDSSSGVSGIVERTRDNGILHGTAAAGSENELLNLSFLPLDADLSPGDTVITSGLAGIFPKGIPVGEVTEVSQSDDGMRNQAVVTPWVDFNHLEEVMIITTIPVDVEEALQ